jgi:glycosyltransferase involved in cell wall biosynthesis
MTLVTSNKPSLSVIVPIYNEAEALTGFLPGLVNACQNNGWQLILVDDGSTDDSGKLIANFNRHPGITVLHHKLNRGYGGALKTGILQATTSHIVTIDSDGQHDVSDIAPMYQLALQKDADLVIGTRNHTNHPDSVREFAKWLIRLYTRILMPLPIHDLNSGFKLHRTELARKYLPLCPNSIAFSDAITLAFLWQRDLVLEHPVLVHERQTSRSTVGFQDAFKILLTITSLVLLFNPLRIFIPLSIACIFIGLGWGAYIVLSGRGVSVGAMLAIITGLLFAILGLITSQISSFRLSTLEDLHPRKISNE